jgi:hypothetical protein
MKGEVAKVQGTLITSGRLALMLLLYAKGPLGKRNEPVEGRTRLTKLLFLLDKEHDAFKRFAKLEFTPYAFGPYDPKVYDDLAFLENMGWLQGSGTTAAESQPPSFSQLVGERGESETSYAFLESSEVEEADLSFEYLMGGVSENVPERYETRKYSLSAEGITAVQHALNVYRSSEDLPKLTAEIEQVKKRFNDVPLRELLRYVYRKYPESATDSTILEELRLR